MHPHAKLYAAVNGCLKSTARAAAQIRHANIVSIHEVGDTVGVYYIASDLIEGESLRQRLRKGHRFTAKQTAILVRKLALAQALGYQLIKLGYVVLYRSIFDVVRDFLHDEAMDGHDRVMSRYLKPELLIIDDFGIKELPKRSGEFLFKIVMRRYETRSTIMTTNRPLEDWGKLLGDVPTATAILDRFLHHAEIITITGKSYRLSHRHGSADKSNQAKAPLGSKKSEKDSKPAKAPTGSPSETNEGKSQ